MMKLDVDVARGYDVMRGKKVIEHFDNYEKAWAYAQEKHLTVRYWTKPSAKGEE